MPRSFAALSLLLSGLAWGADCPCYDAAGALLAPRDYREWIFLSAGLDMTYGPLAMMSSHSMFDNVFVDARSWAEFKKSGHWPDRTMLVMEVRGATGKGSINRKGMFQTGELMGVEVHLRDDARFPDGWRFFAFGGDEPAPPIAQEADCYSCHRQHGALDTTFTQFYPTAKEIAVRMGTYKGE